MQPVGDSDFASKREGGNLVIRQIQAAQTEPFLNVGAQQGTGTGMVVGALPFSSRVPLAPEPLPGSPRGNPLCSPPLCSCHGFSSLASPASPGSLGSIQIVPRISIVEVRP